MSTAEIKGSNPPESPVLSTRKVIEIDGITPYSPPAFLGSSHNEAQNNIVGLRVYEANLRLLNENPAVVSYMESVIRYGKGYNFPAIIGLYAGHLAQKGQILELHPQLPQKEPFDHLGSGLKEGLIVFKGDVEEVEGLRGGILYIDGNVGNLQLGSSGIIYINGDLDCLIQKNNESKEIVIVAGKVDRYVWYPSYSSRNFHSYRDQVPFSPYIFTSHPLQVTEVKTTMYVEMDETEKSYFPTDSSCVVAKQSLENWVPEAVEKQAIELCQERLCSFLGDLSAQVEEIDNLEGFTQVSRCLINGYINGLRVKRPSSSYFDFD